MHYSIIFLQKLFYSFLKYFSDGRFNGIGVEILREKIHRMVVFGTEIQ